jgi:acetylornithine/N-succinyldiaminopimelate aminotransferase
MKTTDIISSYQEFIVPTYGRFPLAIERGNGIKVWDFSGKEYLDFGAGIAVCSLGHGNVEVADALAKQAKELVHTSNLYYTEPQVRLAQKIVSLVGKGKCFFCNSGAEANEALFKLARKFGHDQKKYEVITTQNSFHGRTLAAIAATGQDKVKKGFEPAVEGFRHVPYNDLEAMRQAISDKTAAILIEGIQGESGIHPTTREYLLGLRKLCNEKGILFMMDAVQCGMFRTGKFLSFQRMLEDNAEALKSFLPDAISMAKGVAGGIPLGCVWIREPYSTLLGPGTHGTTFGGTPLACVASLKTFEIIEREGLAENARKMGLFLLNALKNLKSPHIHEVRGVGLMIGIELNTSSADLNIEGKTPALIFVQKLHEAGLLTIPAGNQTIRLLPALNVTQTEADAAVQIINQELKKLS